MKFIKSLMPYFLIVVGVVLVRSFVMTPVRVSGTSMYPTLNGGEVMILNKLAKIDRFDIVVVKREDDDENLIKRVIGLPKETVEIKNNKVYINDEVLNEDEYGYLDPLKTILEANYSMKKITLKENEYFVLGDNRLNSVDSHIFGAIKDSEIEGQASFIIYPFKSFGLVKNKNN